MPFDILTWALTYAANKTLDHFLGAWLSPDLPTKLRNCVSKWSKAVPSEYYVNPEAIFPNIDIQSDTLKRPHLQALSNRFNSKIIPDSDLWLSALIEQWELIKTKLKNDAQPFFQQPKDNIKPHLYQLANDLCRICQEDEKLFRPMVIEMLNKIKNGIDKQENTIKLEIGNQTIISNLNIFINIKDPEEIRRKLGQFLSGEWVLKPSYATDVKGIQESEEKKWGEIIDEDNLLNSHEREELRTYIINDFMSSNIEQRTLKCIKLRSDGFVGYNSYYTFRFEKENTRVTNFEGVIILNNSYLITLGKMKNFLAHEYGHHFTMGFIYSRTDQSIPIEEVIKPYYKIRGLSPEEYPMDGTKGYIYNIFEILAEDYVYFFTPVSREHRMKDLVGYPPPEVKKFIIELKELI